MTVVRNDQFDHKRGLDRGRSRKVEAVWYIIKCIFLLSPLPWPISLRIWWLKRFGAKIGRGAVIKQRVNIHLPWKLTVGEYAWIGEEVFILNFEPVRIGSHACISQRAFLCAGNHDFRDPAMSYRNAPIVVGDGAWIGAQVFVGPGVSVGTEAVALAGSVITKNLPDKMICGGNPCIALRPRWRDDQSVT